MQNEQSNCFARPTLCQLLGIQSTALSAQIYSK